MSLVGIALIATGHGFTHITIASLSSGFIGLFISTLLWTVRPRSIMSWPKCLKRLSQRLVYNDSKNGSRDTVVLDREKAEMVMKSIRGIPYLIQVSED